MTHLNGSFDEEDLKTSESGENLAFVHLCGDRVLGARAKLQLSVYKKIKILLNVLTCRALDT